MKTLFIDNRDTLAHIDTYQMLPGDSYAEYEVDSLCEEYGDDTLTYDDFDWNYDHKAIVADFAKLSLAYVLEQVAEYLEVKGIEAKIVETGSPRFYNYTTDWYVYEVNVPDGVLADYYARNMDACNTRLASYGSMNAEKENWAHATWCEIVDRAITKDASGEEHDMDSYNYHLWEHEMEVYMENTEITRSSKVTE